MRKFFFRKIPQLTTERSIQWYYIFILRVEIETDDREKKIIFCILLFWHIISFSFSFSLLTTKLLHNLNFRLFAIIIQQRYLLSLLFYLLTFFVFFFFKKVKISGFFNHFFVVCCILASFNYITITNKSDLTL